MQEIAGRWGQTRVGHVRKFVGEKGTQVLGLFDKAHNGRVVFAFTEHLAAR